MANIREKELSKDEYSEILLFKLNEGRKNEKFTDVVLHCGGVRIPAHRNILAASSDYFAAMFNGHFPESKQNDIFLQELDPKCFKILIEFIYTGQLEIDENCVQELLATVSFLQLRYGEDFLEYVLSYLNPDNCLGVWWQIVDKQFDVKFSEAVKDYIISNFKKVVKGEEFLDMPFEELAAILSNDTQYMQSNDEVLRNVVRWIEHKPDERAQHLHLIDYINPACVSLEVANSCTILKNESRSSRWLEDVKWCCSHRYSRMFVLSRKNKEPQLRSLDLSCVNFKTLTAPPMASVNLDSMSLTGYRNMLYVQGGSVDGQPQSERYCYNIFKDQWHKLKNLEFERSRHCSVVLQENLYAIGGYRLGDCTNSVEYLNLATNKSSLVENMFGLRCMFGAVVKDQAIYVMGSDSKDSALLTAECYDPRVGNWINLPSRSIDFVCASIALVGDNIYCSLEMGDMVRFDLRTNKWEEMCIDCLPDFYGGEVFSLDERLFLYDRQFFAVSEFDFNKNKWKDEHKFDNLDFNRSNNIVDHAIALNVIQGRDFLLRDSLARDILPRESLARDILPRTVCSLL